MDDLESGLEDEKRGRLQYSLEYNFRSQEVGLGATGSGRKFMARFTG